MITTERGAQWWRLVLHGELDLASAPVLERQLREAEAIGIEHVVVDLSGLEFFDSAGLHLLLSARRRLQNNGQRLLLRRGPRAVQRMFELTRTDAIFQFDD